MTMYKLKNYLLGGLMIIGVVFGVCIFFGLIFLFFTPPGWIILGIIVAKLLGAF